MSKIFGIGLNKTATTTLHEALTILGFRSLHYKARPDDEPADDAVFRAQEEGLPLLTYIAGYDAYSDIWPLIHNFDVLDEQYPGSRFVLTVRPVDQWIDSRRRHVERNIARRQAGDYDGDFLVVDEALWREQWERQVGRARRYFKGRRDFLEVNFTADPGWVQLCEFLELPEPDAPFPWANRDRRRGADPC